MRNRPTLTASDTEKMVAASRAEAAKNKWNVSIAVVDDAGYLLHLERLDGAGPMTAEVAAGKARTAAVTRRPTKFWRTGSRNVPSSSNSRTTCRFKAGCRSCTRANA